MTGNRHQFAERLDKDVLEASLAAEKRIARFGEPYWSIALASARKKGQVLQKQLSMLRTGIANQNTIDSEWSALGMCRERGVGRLELIIKIAA